MSKCCYILNSILHFRFRLLSIFGIDQADKIFCFFFRLLLLLISILYYNKIKKRGQSWFENRQNIKFTSLLLENIFVIYWLKMNGKLPFHFHDLLQGNLWLLFTFISFSFSEKQKNHFHEWNISSLFCHVFSMETVRHLSNRKYRKNKNEDKIFISVSMLLHFDVILFFNFFCGSFYVSWRLFINSKVKTESNLIRSLIIHL